MLYSVVLISYHFLPFSLLGHIISAHNKVWIPEICREFLYAEISIKHI